MASGYVDVSAQGVALGQVSGGAQSRFSALAAPSAGVLQLAGALPNTTAILRGVTDPSAATDAATKNYVDTVVGQQVRGLQLKPSVQLASRCL